MKIYRLYAAALCLSVAACSTNRQPASTRRSGGLLAPATKQTGPAVGNAHWETRSAASSQDASFVYEGRFSSTVSGETNSLFYRTYQPAPEPGQERLVIVLVHGLKGHSGQLSRLAQNLIERIGTQYSPEVWLYDQPHHGRSAGKKVTGNVDTISENVGHLRNFLNLVSAERSNLPIALFGHSMGGLVVASFTSEFGAEFPLKGVVLSAPALRLFDDEFDRLQAHVVKKVGSQVPARSPAIPDFLANDRFVKAKTFSGKVLWDEKAKIAELKADPLVNSGLHSIPTAEALIRGIDDFQAKLKSPDAAFLANMNVPFLLVHARGDEITNPDGSRQLAAFVSQRRGEMGRAAWTKINILNDYRFHDIPGLMPDRMAGEIATWFAQKDFGTSPATRGSSASSPPAQLTSECRKLILDAAAKALQLPNLRDEQWDVQISRIPDGRLVGAARKINDGDFEATFYLSEDCGSVTGEVGN